MPHVIDGVSLGRIDHEHPSQHVAAAMEDSALEDPGRDLGRGVRVGAKGMGSRYTLAAHATKDNSADWAWMRRWTWGGHG